MAGKAATGKDPDFFLSYKPFADNEKNAKAYFPNVPHYLLDEPNHGGFDPAQHQDVDFIQTLCPCAGLSLLSSGSPEQRAGMNKWMIDTARFVTSEVKPKVFWGENAPALYTKNGEGVRAQLREIAAENGYAFSIYCTNTMYHGIPQSRKRTFYFFWRDTNAPVFDYFRAPVKGLVDYIDEVQVGELYHTTEDLKAAEAKLYDNAYVQFLQHKFNGKGIQALRDYIIEKDKTNTTVTTYLIRSEQIEEARDWFETKQADGVMYQRAFKDATRIIAKIATGGGIWDGSYPIYRADGVSSTLISRTISAIHPRDDRLITFREAMHMMGLPSDFELVNGQHNNICQNVPVCTATDMTREVIAYLKGERTISNAAFLMQSNLTSRIDVCQSSLLEF